MSSDQPFDLSTERIPTAWKQAAEAAPTASAAEVPRRRRVGMQWIPDRNQVDNFPAMLAAVVVCSMVGYGWYELEMSRGSFQEWMALALGAATAVAVRFGGGRPNYRYRAGLSLVFYGLTLAVVFYLLARASYIVTYGRSPSYLDIERQFLTARLTDPLTIATCLGGAIIAVAISYHTRPKFI